LLFVRLDFLDARSHCCFQHAGVVDHGSPGGRVHGKPVIGTGTRGVIGEVFFYDASAEGHGPENGDMTGSVVGEPEGDVGVSLA